MHLRLTQAQRFPKFRKTCFLATPVWKILAARGLETIKFLSLASLVYNFISCYVHFWEQKIADNLLSYCIINYALSMKSCWPKKRSSVLCMSQYFWQLSIISRSAFHAISKTSCITHFKQRSSGPEISVSNIDI